MAMLKKLVAASRTFILSPPSLEPTTALTPPSSRSATHTHQPATYDSTNLSRSTFKPFVSARNMVPHPSNVHARLIADSYMATFLIKAFPAVQQESMMRSQTSAKRAAEAAMPSTPILAYLAIAGCMAAGNYGALRLVASHGNPQDCVVHFSIF